MTRWLIAMALVLGLSVSAPGQEKAPPAKRAPKGLDAVPSRALAKARKVGPAVLRLSAVLDTSEEDEKVVVMLELAGGLVGIYSGFIDEASDQWILLEKQNIPVVLESAERAKERW